VLNKLLKLAFDLQRVWLLDRSIIQHVSSMQLMCNRFEIIRSLSPFSVPHCTRNKCTARVSTLLCFVSVYFSYFYFFLYVGS